MTRPSIVSDRAQPELAFLTAGGTTGALLRAIDWTGHPLGAPQHWRQPLKAMVRMMLTTRHPVCLFWGAERFYFYNDAFSVSLGPEKHPSGLAQPGAQVWAEVWPTIGPQLAMVMRGEDSTWFENQLIPIQRHGGMSQAYWTYSQGPIDDPDAPNGIGGVLVLCSETTSQMEDRRQLVSERERFDALFTQAPTFMAVLRGPEHIFELANPAYRALIGERDVVGRTVAEALPEIVAQGYVALLDEVYRSGKPYRADDNRVHLLAADGAPTERFLDFVYQPITSAHGAVDGIFVVGTDVTERHHALQALHDADRRKDEYLATLAHELRNPLSAVRSAAHLLRSTRADAALTARAAEIVDRQSVAMGRLLDGLLDAARITSGKMALAWRRVPLQSVVDAAVESAQAQIDAHGHALQVQVTQPTQMIDCDPLRMAQVLGNLLTNAAKYTDPGGRITFEAGSDGANAWFEVRDNGIGIEPAVIPRLFEMFEQGPREGRRTQPGLGIGLAVARALVAMHGGTVEGRSDGPGHGSSFRVELPLHTVDESACAAIQADARARGEPAASAAGASAMTVLVADDNVDAATTLAAMLEIEGFRVVVAHDGQAAWALANEHAPAACLLDLGMPGLDGLSLAQRLRREAPGGGDMLLVAITGWTQHSDRARTLAAGFDAHLGKPAEPAAVIGLLQAHAASGQRRTPA